MKWIVVIVIGVLLAIWLYRGKRRNPAEDPEIKTYEEKDFYLTSDDNTSEKAVSAESNNPRH